MISFETDFLILFTNPDEPDGVEGAFVVFVASFPSGLTDPDEPDGVAANAKVHAIGHEAGGGCILQHSDETNLDSISERKATMFAQPRPILQLILV
ncbi:MAG TPA: hypothetical protein PLY87_28975 [Planctomycetaceae bacterium]|nr:hypothetical protein [Planctomycetaceae bacterium]HQZ69169.1 hypothetical protein [Planctomycetaceae bacterium]